jgi:hypothetical protein
MKKRERGMCACASRKTSYTIIIFIKANSSEGNNKMWAVNYSEMHTINLLIETDTHRAERFISHISLPMAQEIDRHSSARLDARAFTFGGKLLSI